MKRFVVLVLLLAFMVPAGFAMGTRGSGGGGALSEVTLKFYFGGNKPKDEDMVWENVAKLSKSALNAKFVVNHIPWAEYGDRIKLMTASGDNYDMHFDAYWMTFPALVANNALYVLNDIFPKYAPKLYDEQSKSGLLKGVTVNGKILAVPWNFPKSFHPVAIIREDLRKKYNLPAKFDTIEDLEAFMSAVLKQNPGMTPIESVFKEQAGTDADPVLWLVMTKYEYDYPMITANRFTYNLNDPKVTMLALERTEAYREACKIRRQWYEKGFIPKDALNKSEEGNRFAGGNTICLVFTLEPAYQDYSFEAKGYFMYRDKKSVWDGPLGNTNVINAKAANPERTMMFLEWHNAAQANYDAVMYGIEGVTYVLKEFAGLPKKIADYAPGQDINTSFIQWNGRWGLYRYKWMRGGPGDQGAKYIAEGIPQAIAMKTNMTSRLAGFNFDPEPVKTELARRAAVWAELAVPLIFGMVADVDKAVDELIQREKEAGTDAILAEYQKQVNAFLASSK